MMVPEQGVTTELIAAFNSSCLPPAEGMLGGAAEAGEQQDYK